MWEMIYNWLYRACTFVLIVWPSFQFGKYIGKHGWASLFD